MKIDIAGNFVPSILVTIQGGETIFAESGLLVYKDPTISQSITTLSSVTGSLLGSITRSALGGLPFLMLTFTGNGSLALSRSRVGNIKVVNLKDGEVLDLMEHSLICAESTVKYDYFHVRGTARIGRMMGFFMDRITGPGLVAYHGDGAILSFNLADGESISVDYGALLSKEPSVILEPYNLPFGGGLIGHALSFEAVKVSGPGHVEIQTKDPYAKKV